MFLLSTVHRILICHLGFIENYEAFHVNNVILNGVLKSITILAGTQLLYARVTRPLISMHGSIQGSDYS